MKIRERLLECKIKAGIKSDYKLAEVLGTSRQRISEVMNGKCKPDAYIAVKMADILKVHPLMLLAEFEAETAKDETRRSFWINFAQRIKTGAIGMLVLTSTAFWLPEAKAEPAVPEIRIMPSYERKRPRRLTITSRLKRRFFFALHLHSSSFVRTLQSNFKSKALCMKGDGRTLFVFPAPTQQTGRQPMRASAKT